MSCILLAENTVQMGVYSSGDTYTHIRAGSVERPGISCDTASDLPAQAGGITGYYLEQGSCAHVIDENALYIIQSDGTWVKQEQSPFSDIYTKSEVDSLLTPIRDDITTLYTADSDINSKIAALIDEGAKNRLNVFAVSSQTISDVTWTVNSDGTVTANGTATANSFFFIIPSNTNVAFGEETHISGCPSGGSASTYEIQVSQTGGTTYHDYGDGEFIPYDYVYRYFVLCVRSGYTANNLVFRPMICDAWKYTMTPVFVPYSPTNAELAALIRSYHP